VSPRLHPQAAAALALWAEDPPDSTLDERGIAERRRSALVAAAAEPREDVAQVEDVDADGVRCRIYRPDGAGGTILYAHGGGFVFGELDTHDAHARRVANRIGYAVVSMDYRRPPEHKFPAAPDDLDTALRWLQQHGLEHGLDVANLVALGDSAGANLALVAALRNPGAFTKVVLVYPFIDPSVSRPSYAAAYSGLDRADARWYWSHYVSDPADLTDPDVAPIESTRLGTLPPTLVLAAECDTLLDENIELVRRIRDAGGDVELSVQAGMVHGFWRHTTLFDAAEQSLAEIAAYVA
jgi:acetyl esterase